jgi:FlaA1/EpsC-like NDP-sugar epimerase
LISALSFLPLWINDVLDRTDQLVPVRNILFCVVLQMIILVGLSQSESLYHFFNFNISIWAIAIHGLVNFAFLIGFISLLWAFYNSRATVRKVSFEEMLEDVLERKHIQVNKETIGEAYKGKIILITGAAGSIGGEIARQITRFGCEEVILVDQTEAGLYDLFLEFKGQSNHKVQTVLGDVRDKKGMQKLFERFNPEIIFHAAAYKQVPFMEDQPYDAIRTNVCGTKIMVDLAIEFEVTQFILISTDKAVNPTTVMGATKKLAELYCNGQNIEQQTKFIITRFGNVFGSSGSVIPLFYEQIMAGGPVTVTDKEVKRFFMSISEACQLVLEAGTMGKGGEIFVFDMGEPIKIMDLAQRMIKLAKRSDIQIKIIGLRTGEKLEEELFSDDENLQPTYHDKIKIAKVSEISSQKVLSNINDLCIVNARGNSEASLSALKRILGESGESSI